MLDLGEDRGRVVRGAIVQRIPELVRAGGLHAAGPPTRRARHPTRGAALSYARIFLVTVILIAVAFYLLKVTIVAAIFGVFALIVLTIVLKEGL